MCDATDSHGARSPSEPLAIPVKPRVSSQSKSQPGYKPRRRTYLACTFCRSRKQRCDAKQPQCGNCMLQKAECVYKPTSKRATVTQQYVQNLLQQIEDLRSQQEGSEPTPSALRAGCKLPYDAESTIVLSAVNLPVSFVLSPASRDASLRQRHGIAVALDRIFKPNCGR